MIKELRVKNFLSFKEEQVVSFEATDEQGLEEVYVKVVSDVRLLRCAVVYGANASGKSNLLVAFNYLREFFFSKKDSIDETTGVVPFAFDEELRKSPTVFVLSFYVGSIPYEYQLELDAKQVYLERLTIYQKGNPTIIFKRELQRKRSVIDFNTEIAKFTPTEQEQISLKCLTNMSLFAVLGQLNLQLPDELSRVRDWLQHNWLPVVGVNAQLMNYARDRFITDKSLLERVTTFVQKADINISRLSLREKRQSVPTEILQRLREDEDIPLEIRRSLSAKDTISSYELDFEHEIRDGESAKKYHLPLSLQSEGTQRLIGLETLVLDALEHGAFLCIDEIEKSLHPELIKFLIADFLSQNSEAQLLITTHNVTLLGAVDSLLRRDVVWFTEKDTRSGATHLSALVEYRDLDSLSSFEKAYLQGRFGAIPDIKGI
jgi:putative ATP-binding protein